MRGVAPWLVLGLALGGCAQGELADADIEEKPPKGEDTGVAPMDTGTPADTNIAPMDTGAATDAPSVDGRDATPMDTGAAVDSGVAPMDTGVAVDTGTDTGAAVDTAPPPPDLPTMPGCTGGTGVMDPATGHCYWRVAGFDWATARMACTSSGGHTVTIRNAAENALVRERFSSSLPAWIGFNDLTTAGTWEWVTREPIEYRNWLVGRPDRVTMGARRCAVILAEGTWSDRSCDETHDVVCERD